MNVLFVKLLSVHLEFDLAILQTSELFCLYYVSIRESVCISLLGISWHAGPHATIKDPVIMWYKNNSFLGELRLNRSAFAVTNPYVYRLHSFKQTNLRATN